jgi:rare lipoprotein A
LIKHIVCAAVVAAGCCWVPAANAATQAGGECGDATWYSLPGHYTADGEVMNKTSFTAAHKHLPFGSYVRVTNQKTGKSIQVKITDRGPFGRGKIIDLSWAAASAMGMIKSGVIPVCISRV